MAMVLEGEKAKQMDLELAAVLENGDAFDKAAAEFLKREVMYGGENYHAFGTNGETLDLCIKFRDRDGENRYIDYDDVSSLDTLKWQWSVDHGFYNAEYEDILTIERQPLQLKKRPEYMDYLERTGFDFSDGDYDDEIDDGMEMEM